MYHRKKNRQPASRHILDSALTIQASDDD